MKKKIFDICVFNINNYLESTYVSDCFYHNYKLFEKYLEKNKNIEINWHIIDEIKIKEIAENFNLKYTKRRIKKGEYQLDEIKFFLATQYENYITFPVDLYILEDNLYNGNFDKLFDENNYINAYIQGNEKSKSEFIIINPNNIIKSINKNGTFIKRVLNLFENYFENESWSFLISEEFNNLNIENISVRELIYNKKILDFEIREIIVDFLYLPLKKIVTEFNKFKENCPIKDFNYIFISNNAYPLSEERKFAYSVHMLPDIFEDEILKSNFLEIFPNAAIIKASKDNKFVSKEIIFSGIKDIVNSIEGIEVVDYSNFAYYAMLIHYLQLIYKYNGNHKFNIYSAVDFKIRAIDLKIFGKFWEDYCYENKDKPDEFIPLPYLNLDDAVQKLCW